MSPWLLLLVLHGFRASGGGLGKGDQDIGGGSLDRGGLEEYNQITSGDIQMAVKEETTLPSGNGTVNQEESTKQVRSLLRTLSRSSRLVHLRALGSCSL